MNAVGNFIFLLHLAMFLFCVIVPFFGSDELVLMNLVFMIGVLFHWMLNNNTCALTEFEKWITGNCDDTSTFFGRLFGDFYTKTEKYGHVSWVVILILIAISLRKVVKNKTLQKIIHGRDNNNIKV